MARWQVKMPNICIRCASRCAACAWCCAWPKRFVPIGSLAGLYKDVSELCIALGRIREWDVFIAQTVQPMCVRMAGHAGLQALLAASERQRAACYAALRGEAQARERQRLLLRFAIWMNGDYWKQTDRGRAAGAGFRHKPFAQVGQTICAIRAAAGNCRCGAIACSCASSPRNSDTARNFSRHYMTVRKPGLILPH